MKSVCGARCGTERRNPGTETRQPERRFCGRERASRRLSCASRVNGHHGASDIASALTHEKCRHRRDVLWLSQSVQWAAGNNALAVWFFEAARHVCVYKTGCDRVHGYAELSDFPSQGLRESDEGRLRRRVDGKAVEAARGDDRAHIDHSPSSLRHHSSHYIFAQQDRGQRVQADQGPNLRVRHGGEQALRAEPDVVDETIHRAKLSAQLSHERWNHRGIAQIEGTKLEGA